ncbi:hypothetical protein OG21DRAFT_913855 [Imleria badia]|nr:hypothetical protein OG21DRAFT_913855 [Imleria badia]
MDEEITGPKSVLFNISAQRNPPSFISRLPTETLEAIFIHGACDYHSEASGHAIASAPSWVNVSYVCRHWRSVALHCATLWTYLFLTSPRWTNELLARSKQAPLKLHVNMSYVGVSFKVGLYSLDQVMKHVERVQECHISLPLVPVMQENWLVSKLSSPAPRLQHLTISVPDVPWEWQLPSELFDGDTPALRTLELIGCRVAWYSLQLSGLTTLSLCRVPARFHQNTGDLLATLRCMQDLTHLCLDHALASAAGFLSSAAFHTFQKINLPHLSRFWIAAPLSTVNALLSCINIPLKTEVRLECHFEHGSSLDDYAMFSSLLAKRFNVSAQSSPTICSLAVKQWSEMAKLTFSGSKLDDPAVSVMQMDGIAAFLCKSLFILADQYR